MRQEFLKTILPALLTVFIYFVAAPRLGSFGDWLNPQGAVERLRQQVNAARSRGPSAEDLLRQSLEVDDLREVSTRLRREQADLTARWTKLIEQAGNSIDRTEIFARTLSLLTRHGLLAIEQGTAGEGQGQVPASLKAVLNQLTEGRAEAGQVYRVRCRGRYVDLAAALRELTDSASPVVPIGLTMEEADWDGPVRTWALLLWM